MNPATPLQKRCSSCGAAFECGMGQDTPCWCSIEFPAVMPVPDAAKGCYCRKCLAPLIETIRQEKKAT
ncbi:MAG TPA: cysteine-rich CWC family protein [Burkholderiales bacterium]|nr:cysteine-rich CWC family protein [Burkholderiales bacterium]